MMIPPGHRLRGPIDNIRDAIAHADGRHGLRCPLNVGEHLELAAGFLAEMTADDINDILTTLVDEVVRYDMERGH